MPSLLTSSGPGGPTLLYPPLERDVSNSLLGLAYARNPPQWPQSTGSGIDAMLMRGNMYRNLSPLDQVIAAGIARQPPPSLPAYAPPSVLEPPPRWGSDPTIGSDPRFAGLRPSDLIEDRRPTELLLRAGLSPYEPYEELSKPYGKSS